MDSPQMPRRSFVLGAAALTTLPALAVQSARVDEAGIRLVIPFPPGGVIDTLARPLAEQAGTHLQKTEIGIDYVDGQRGCLGTARVAKAAPDGRTLLIGSIASHIISCWNSPAPPYDPVHDFTPITLIARAANVVVLSPASARRLGVRDTADLIDQARRRPGKLNYATIGVGSVGQLAGELFRQRTGVDITHRPYAGTNPAQAAVLASEVDFGFLNVASCADDVRAGRLHALAVTTMRRSPELPDVPALAESAAPLGLAGFDMSFWLAMFGPAGLPHEQVLKLNGAFVSALNSAPLHKQLAELKLEPAPSTPEQLGALVRADSQRLRELVQQSRARI